MFAGRYIHKIDEKGRIALPAKMMKAGIGLGYTEFVITKGIGKCLSIFPANKFEEFINNFDPSYLSFEDGLNFYREFASWAHYTSVDTQGRILIPQILQEESNIRDETLILGVVDWIEVWDPKKYSEFKEKSKTDYDSGAKMFFGSLIRGKRAKNANSETSERSDG